MKVQSKAGRIFGTWEVKAAAFDDSHGAAQGRVAYAVDQASFYGSANGANDPEAERPSSTGEVIITLVGSNQAYVGEQEFTRSVSRACS